MLQERIDPVVKGYELREQIGAGGYGVVHRAYQPLIGRDVAVKIILPQYANHPDFIRRFEWEAQLVARLEHPYIVPLYDYWRDPDGAFLVMRWLRGGNLHDLLHNRPLPTELLGRLIEQVGSALAVAHRRGVVHRDLKPANILLDEEGNAYLADFGIAKDLGTRVSPYQTDTSTVVGSPAYISPEQVRAEPITPQTDIYSLGVMLYEILTGQLPFQAPTPIALMFMHMNEPVPTVRTQRPDLSDAVNLVIQKATAKRPADRYTDVTTLLQELRQALASGPAVTARLTDALPTPSQPEPGNRTTSGTSTRSKYETGVLYLPVPLAEPIATEIENPYKGLRAFQEADASDFFGRDMLTQLLLARMQEQVPLGRFLAVVGPSGSGKSSVVRAGLVPAIRRGGLPGSQNWFVVEMFPSAHPIEELAQALIRVAVEPPNNLVEPLRLDEQGLLRVVDQVVPGADETEVVLVIDQFEEVFTLVEDEAVRTHFLNSLINAVTDPYSRIRVIVTLRADFYDRPLLYPGFSELMRQRTEVVVPLAPEELKQAIISPAERNGLRVDPELVEAIVNDVAEQPGALPLLQYALTEVFERRSSRTLTLTPYNASGGVLGALARRAEDIYIGLTDEQQEAARQLFLRLVTLGEGVEDTRRRVRRTELATMTKDEGRGTNGASTTTLSSLVVGPSLNLDHVIEQYSQYRLLTLDNDPATRVPTVEVAHEALIRTWMRLRQWLDASRDDLRLQRRMTAAAAEWAASGHDRSFLASGARLEQLAGWADETHLALNAEERDYLSASLAERDTQWVQEEARKSHEAMLERRSRTFLRALVAVFGVAAVVALGLSIFAFGQRREAQRNFTTAATAEAQAQQNATLAKNEADRAEQNATLAKSEADRAKQNADLARDRAVVAGALAAYYQDNIDQARALARLVVKKPQPVEFAENTFSNVVYGPGTRRVFQAHKDGVNGVAFSPDETMAVSAGKDNVMILWDLKTYQELGRFEGGHTLPVRQIYFLPDGKRILTGSEDKTAILWDVATLKPIRVFKKHAGEVRGMALRPGSNQFVTGSGDSTLMLWDLNCVTPTPQECNTPIRVFEKGNGGHTQQVNQIAFTSDGSKLLSTGQDGNIILWDVETATPLKSMAPPTPFEVRTVAVLPGDQYALSAGNRPYLTLWDINTGQAVRTFVGHTRDVYDLAVSQDGKYALSGSVDNTLMLWNLAGDSLIVRPAQILHGHGSYIRELVFSKDGRRALTGSADTTMRLWDLFNGAELTRQDVGAGVNSAALSPDGRYMAAATSSGEAKLWDLSTGQIIRQFPWHERGVKTVAIDPDGKFVLTGGDKRDGALILSSIETGQPVPGKFTFRTFGINALAFSPDGKYIVSGQIAPVDTDYQADKKLNPELKDIGMILWDASTGKVIHTFPELKSSANALAFSPDGTRLLAAVGNDVTVWEIPSGRKIGTLVGASGKINSMDVTRDFKTALVGGRDKTFTVWNVATGARWTSEALAAEINEVAISQDSAFAAVSSESKVFLFDLNAKRVIRTFIGNTDSVRQLEFSADGRTLFSGSLDGTVRTWRLDTREEMIAWAEANRYFPDLTCDQTKLYGLEQPCA